MKDSKYCFAHNPDTKEQHKRAVIKGGKNSSRLDALDLDEISLQKPRGVVDLLEETINGVRSSDIPPKIANTIGYLSGQLLKAIESSDLDERLEVIERVIFERKRIKTNEKK